MAVVPYDNLDRPVRSAPSRSIPSILAILAAIASFFVYHGTWGFILAIAAILLGVIGFFLAASPRVSGGIISLIAIGLGIVGLVFAILRGALHVLS